MARKNKPKKQIICPETLIIFAYVATLVLAGFMIDRGVQSPEAWGFIGAVIAALFSRLPSQKQ